MLLLYSQKAQVDVILLCWHLCLFPDCVFCSSSFFETLLFCIYIHPLSFCIQVYVFTFLYKS